MAHSHTHRHSHTVQRNIALALLLLLFGMLGAPLATAQQPAHMPTCCMDAQHCSMHQHRAGPVHDAQDLTLQLAALAPRCPCTPLAPASFASHGVPLIRSIGYAVALRAQTVGPARAAPVARLQRSRADATRGPPPQAAVQVAV